MSISTDLIDTLNDVSHKRQIMEENKNFYKK